jgi:hypothetical protein
MILFEALNVAPVRAAPAIDRVMDYDTTRDVVMEVFDFQIVDVSLIWNSLDLSNFILNNPAVFLKL